MSFRPPLPVRRPSHEASRDARRRDLLDIYRHALAAVSGRSRVRAALAGERLDGPVRMVALGKAAGAMALGAFDAPGVDVESALIVTRRGHDRGPVGSTAIRLIESAHPLPDQHSLAAGEALIDFVDATPSTASLLFLISGGTSSLVEAPRDGIDLEGLRRAYGWLLGSGLPIAAVNRVRMRLSRIKGGQLAGRLRGQRVLQLMISDVPGDDPATIGSGLLSPAMEDKHWPDIEQRLPGWLRDMVAGAEMPAAGGAIETRLIATIGDACDAAAARAGALGYRTDIAQALLEGDAVEAGHAIAAGLSVAAPGLYVHGGETVVALPDMPGRGGRCQSLALAAALDIAGRDDLYLLAAGTDGCDGSGGAAGALIDGATLDRGMRAGLDPDGCLRRADAGAFLDLAGDLIYTGAGNTNVMDLVLGLRVVASPEAADV